MPFLVLCFLVRINLCNLQIEAARARIVRLIESTLLLSNVDLVASYVFKREKFNLMPVSSRAQSDIIDPAISDAQVSY